MLTFDEKTKKFTEVYSKYYPLVFGSVYSKIRNVDKAKDICQEVFIRFYEKFHIVKNPRAWLHSALRLVFLEYMRNEKGDEENIDEYFQDVSMSFVNGFKDVRCIIKDALEDINVFGDEVLQTLFEMIAVYNFSYKAAGKQLGLTEHQARYKYSLTVKKIIEYFKKRGIQSLEDLL